MLQGVDVHAGYGHIDWRTARLHVRFCWAKCTTGNDPGVDAQFLHNVIGCKSNDVPVGGYHFAYPLPDDPAHPGRSPEEQAERFYKGSDGLGSKDGELPPMVDAEWPAPEDAEKWGCTPQQISDWLRDHCAAVAVKFGRAPVIYTYPAWWKWLADHADVSWAAAYEVVFADYGWPQDGTPPDGWTPPHWGWVKGRPWDDWTVCQYSAEGSKARIPGINACPIDRDCIRDEETLERLCRVTA